MSDNDRLNLLFDLRRYRDAEKLAREIIAKNPEWGAGYTHLARALINLNQKDEAIESAREGVKKQPLDAWAFGTLACALNWFGNARSALEPAQEAVRLDPNYAWARAMLANIFYGLNRFEECRQQALEGLKSDPLSEGLIRWKGWAEYKLNRHAEALASAEEGLKHHPNSHLLMNLIGCVKWGQAERNRGFERVRLHREADVAIRDSIRLDPAQQVYHENLHGNAVSCRKHVLGLVVPALCFVFVVVPVVGLCFGVIPLKQFDKKSWVLIGSALAFAFVCSAVVPQSQSGQVIPLARWNIPEVPLPAKDLKRGRAELYFVGLVMLAPYVFVLAALFW